MMTHLRLIHLMRLAVGLGLLARLIGLPAYPAAAQAPGGSIIYLPVVVRPGSTNPVHTGIATYYNATGSGSCGFGASPGDLMVAAMNAPEFDNAKICGAYVHVSGPKGEVTVRIVDLCPECQAGHLDLSREAFALIADLPQGRVPITWQVISPNLSGPIAYYFETASNGWWDSVQVRNHRNPVAKFEYLKSPGVWVTVDRQPTWNYFYIQNNTQNYGPFTFRVTDAYGNVLVDSGIMVTPGGTVNGAAQFPPGP